MDYFRINRPDGGRNDVDISSDTYPEQNDMYLNKSVTIRFKDESDGTGIVRERNTPYEPQKPVFFVLRWDKSEDGIIIAIDYKLRVVVVPVKEMISHRWYKKQTWDNIIFLYQGELTEKEFNEQIYSKEKIYVYGQQDTTKLLYNVVSEYEKDRFNGVSNTDRNRDNINYFEIVQHVKAEHPDRMMWPDVILRSYNSYYDEHRHSKLDVPMRYVNNGYVIRYDKYHIVVMETNRVGQRRFITDQEANFYLAPEATVKTTWEALNLWRNPLAATWQPYNILNPQISH